jgi:hypothetical protein
VRWVQSTRLVKESKSVMSKRQLIDEIRRYNVSVQPDFLSQFDEQALQQYLEHLEGAFQKRLHISSWVRKQPELKMVS